MGRAGNGCARLSLPGPTPRPAAAVPMRKLRRAIIKRCASGSVRRGDADLMVALLAIFRQRRQAPDGRLGAFPRLRPLRLVAVPGPRIEIAELLILHLVEFDIELDRVVVRVAVIGRDVVAGAVPHRAPEQLDLLGGEHLAGVLHVRDVLELERNVMQLRGRALDEIDGVVIGIAAQEYEPVLDPVGDPETQYLRVEVRHDLHVGNREGDMAELERSYAVHLMMRAEIAPLLEQVDRRPFVVLESQHRSHAGHGIVAQLALDAIGRQRLRKLSKLRVGRDLERQPGARVSIGLVDLDHEQAGLGRQEGAVLLALGQDQAGNVRPIGDLLLDVGRLEGGVTDASWLDHDWTPVAQLEWAAAGDRSLPLSAAPYSRSPAGATLSSQQDLAKAVRRNGEH